LKSNIEQIPFNDGRGLIWWTWKEICDNCGKVIWDSTTLHSDEPNTNEEDLCYECLVGKYSKLVENTTQIN
jgi:hypothetical protein